MHAHSRPNRFDDFYKEGHYLALKNNLYNYRLRCIAVTRYLRTQKIGRILETGCGISPVSKPDHRTVYSDLSYKALAFLKQVNNGRGIFVVADGRELPFKARIFSHVVSSEVLEHIQDDHSAIGEMARVANEIGRMVITFPHRNCYFSRDDHFVNHFRRYEIQDIKNRLDCFGFRVNRIEKILGPLEKLTMLTAVFIYTILTGKGRPQKEPPPGMRSLIEKLFRVFNVFFMVPVWLEAKLLPLSFATVLMVVGQRKPGFAEKPDSGAQEPA